MSNSAWEDFSNFIKEHPNFGNVRVMYVNGKEIIIPLVITQEKYDSLTGVNKENADIAIEIGSLLIQPTLTEDESSEYEVL